MIQARNRWGIQQIRWISKRLVVWFGVFCGSVVKTKYEYIWNFRINVTSQLLIANINSVFLNLWILYVAKWKGGLQLSQYHHQLTSFEHSHIHSIHTFKIDRSYISTESLKLKFRHTNYYERTFLKIHAGIRLQIRLNWLFNSL